MDNLCIYTYSYFVLNDLNILTSVRASVYPQIHTFIYPYTLAFRLAYRAM